MSLSVFSDFRFKNKEDIAFDHLFRTHKLSQTPLVLKIDGIIQKSWNPGISATQRFVIKSLVIRLIIKIACSKNHDQFITLADELLRAQEDENAWQNFTKQKQENWKKELEKISNVSHRPNA